MPLAVSEFQLVLTQLAADLGAKIGILLARLDRLDLREALAFLTDAYPELAGPYIDLAARVTTVYYEDQPVDLTPGPAFIPEVPGDLINPEQLGASARWAWLQDKPIPLLQGSATRAVLNGSRDTMVHNAELEPGARWARHASANACGFCRIMAIRADVYRSQQSATTVVSRNSLQKYGDKYHDNCHCIAVCVRPGDRYEPPAYVEQWEKDYVTATTGEYGASDIGAIGNRMEAIERDRQASPSTPGSRTPAPAARRPKDPEPTPRAATDGPGGPQGPGDGGRTGFSDSGEFPELPDGSRVPFSPADVPPLVDGDHAHFAGTDGSGQGGHIAGLGLDNKTEFPQWVQSLEDLQRVQDAVLANPARVQHGKYGRYEVRGFIEENGTQMVVQVVLEPDGTPAGIYPVNGDFVIRNVKGRPVPQPLDRDALLGWKRGD